MIKLITYDNLEQNGRLFSEHFKLRHQEFIERQDYEVRSYYGREYDEYDTPAASYVVYVENEDGPVLGASRLTPTPHGCMLNDYFPELVDNKSLLNSPQIWEGTRFCIDSNLPGAMRRQICYELALSYVEFGYINNLKMIIGLMPTLILRSVFERSGIFLDRLGKIDEIGQHSKIQAAGIPINLDQLISVKNKTGYFNVLGRPELEQVHAKYIAA